MSPSHQTLQSVHRFCEGAPQISRLATPIVALIVVLSTAARATSPKMSRSRRRSGRKPNQISSDAPTTASSVLPTVIPRAVATGTSVVTFARNAPSATPGHSRRPPSSSAASARPVGGQIPVTLGVAKASASPSFAEPK
jgi:hypothetical protein